MSKKLVLFLGLIFSVPNLWSATGDRFGNTRLEVPRSSYTDTTVFNTVIASAPIEGGSVFVRNIIFSGVVASTITFCDATTFSNVISTVGKFTYNPSLGNAYAEFNFNQYFSSAAMISKDGAAMTIIKWDYTFPPKYGDARK